MADPVVAIETGVGGYPDRSPFDPALPHPEYAGPTSRLPNPAYEGVRSVLQQLYPPGDLHGRGEGWNPLAHLIEPGQTVFIKPNLVDHEHRYGGDIWSVITHPAVVRAVADYVALALRGEGRIIIGDNPHIDCNWDVVTELYGAWALCDRVAAVHGVDVDFIDLRSHHMPDLSYYGWRRARVPLSGDPGGMQTVHVRNSYLDDKRWWLFRGTFNERGETMRAHLRGHRYSFSGTISDADVFVSVPKLKAHAKVGATLNLKGLIGTICNKNALVHWAIGYPRFGGDEFPEPDDWRDYPRLYWQHLVNDVVPSTVQLGVRSALGETALGRRYREAVTVDAQRRRLLRGAWDGNDTTWRMTADVHDAFVGAPGAPPRATLSIIDGIVGGDTDGPHFPHRVAAGAVLGGENMLATDMAAARLMDFDITEIRYLTALGNAHGVLPDRIEVRGLDRPLFAPDARHLGFRPPNRWPDLSIHGLAPAGDVLDDVVHGRPLELAS